MMMILLLVVVLLFDENRSKDKNIAKVGLYIHIPFCKQKCLYCDFFSYSNFDDSIFDKYLSYILKELEIRLKDFNSTNTIIDTIYIGGGTPSLIDASIYKYFFDKLFNIIDKNNIVELTIELNPESTNKELLDYISSFSFSRISLGIQTTNEKSLNEIARIAKLSDIDNALEIIKNSAIKNISVDFIHSLPYNIIGETKKDISYVLEKIDIKHMSIYFLELEEPSIVKKKWDSITLNDDDSVDDFLNVLDYIYSLDFKRYEISNFSLADKYKSKHNLHYWDMDDYIGLGLSSVGSYNNIRYTNTTDMKKYFYAIDNNNLEQSVEELDNEIRKKEFIFLSLRKSIGLNIDAYNKLFNEDFRTLYLEIIRKYEKHLIIKNGYIYLTDHSMLQADDIISSFL